MGSLKYTLLLFVLCSHQSSTKIIYNEHMTENQPKKIIPNEAEDETARIVRGQDAVDGQFPYAVALYYYDQYVCTGSLISETDVLTAAHCIVIDGEEQPASAYTGVIGSADRTTGEVVEFSDIIVHPEFNSTSLANDLTLLTLSNPRLNASEEAVCIAGPGYDNGCKSATIMGWGQLSKNSTDLPNTLQYANVLVHHQFWCKLRHGSIVGGLVTDKHICADGYGKGICHGDSGGPMVYMPEKRPVLIGVASFIRELNLGGRYVGCGSIIVSPSVMTRVSEYNEWILSNAEGEDICVGSL